MMRVQELNTISYFTYYVYIVIDKERKKIEIDVTGDLNSRLIQLRNTGNIPGESPCIHLVYWESFRDAEQTLIREKAIKRLSNKKKKALINNANPEWAFLNEEVHQAAALLPAI
jgi:putative endonuclease